jgi:hypothetical protein
LREIGRGDIISANGIRESFGAFLEIEAERPGWLGHPGNKIIPQWPIPYQWMGFLFVKSEPP